VAIAAVRHTDQYRLVRPLLNQTGLPYLQFPAFIGLMLTRQPVILLRAGELTTRRTALH
jgi:hypothetical protein